ncbi:phage holin family protein [Aequorivita vladivostokensis]|jgi:hypothetical protein|uniref:Phage holin family protein n=1 Tax=Aequorivita vladivostokensis TaxID=171194 RepID=A0ABR5DIL9_9FLAO|nr:phage holin family protein [Aequorivita vladivostokensis]KJJ38635.1 hypothetical protein MB09_08085 [Aequorivita vladivostokensis]MAB58701.1 hypothetical protein [Aequorivita sp.]MBF30033.1 hypothetical protein [Aequorivita sp.]MDX1782797.1 phage holin family protein [Aequorivita vladivostokensis]|tara:strand:+ start:228089 stop:228535 length:447 start_codon:yes stop_codon:yes gene_type:complete
MAFSSLKESLHRVTERIEDYSVSTAEYYKLRLFKASMKGAISLVNLLVYGSLSLFVMLFLSVGAAFWLSTFFENVYVGFLLIGAFYGIILIFMFIFGRKIIERGMLYKFSGLLYDENDLDPKVAAEKELNEYQETLFDDKVQDEKLTN